ncbi:MAG: hypothetical protein RLZZ397_1085 [Pseudomonadota bacterium]
MPHVSLHYIDCPGPLAAHGGPREMAYWQWSQLGCKEPQKYVICVHGLTRQGRDFDALAKCLAPYRTVIAVDLAGRGRSHRLADPLAYAVPTYVSDLFQLLSHLKAESIDWVGTSLGGLIGMTLASLNSSPIHKLVLNDVGPSLEPSGLKRIAQYLSQYRDFDSLEEARAYHRSIHSTFGEHTDQQWDELSHYQFVQRDNGKWHAHYDPSIAAPFANLAAFDDPAIRAHSEQAAWSLYDAIQAPTLLIRGEQSDLLSQTTANQMQTRGPKAQVHVVPGVGHAPTLIDPDQQSVVLKFLLEHAN